MMISEEKKIELIREATDKMLEIAGYSERYADVVDDKDWLDKYKMTEEQDDKFREWFISNARKKYRMSKHMAESYYGEYILMWGLTTEKAKNDTP